MQRFILSVFSVILATSAVAVNAQAVPQLEPSFDFQALRLRELDARNKSADDADISYGQAPGHVSTWKTPQQVWREQAGGVEVEAATDAAEVSESERRQGPSLTERRLDSLDRS